MSEEELINACRNGNKDAQKELYIQYAERVYTLCIRYLGDRENALDYTHDAIIKAFLAISRFKYSGEGSFYVWLRKITINMIIDRLRLNKRIKQVPISTIAEPADEKEDSLLPAVPPEILLQMISCMSEERRIVFNMYCIDGYSHKEIARRLGITEKGSASILAKARALLKKKVFDYVDE